MSAREWEFDTNRSNVSFAVRHMVVSKVRGHFTSWRGDVKIDEDAIERSSADVSLDVASVTTGDVDRDRYLRSPNFFAVERYPAIRFRTSSVARTSRSTLRVRGDLTIRATTRAIVLDVAYEIAANQASFEATSTIARRDFDLRFVGIPDVGGVAVGEKIEIAIRVYAHARATSIERA